VEAPATWEKLRNQLVQRTRRYRRPVQAKNGPIGFHCKVFFGLGLKPLATQHSDPAMCLSTQSFSIKKVSFLPVTPGLQPLILKSVLKARIL
jgi:hypothetical protein